MAEDNLAGIQLATGLASNEVSVETVEHLLAALVSVGVDNVDVEAATRRIDQLYPVWPDHRPLLDRLRDTYQHRSEHVERQREATGSGEEDREIIEHREIQRTVIDSEREALLRLRAEGAIDDDVRRALEHELDLEDMGLR